MPNDSELNQLRARVIELEAKVQFLYKHFEVVYFPSMSEDNAKNAKILELIQKKDMNGAIKLHREMYNSSLPDAKKAIEEMVIR